MRGEVRVDEFIISQLREMDIDPPPPPPLLQSLLLLVAVLLVAVVLVMVGLRSIFLSSNFSTVITTQSQSICFVYHFRRF